VDTPEVYRQRSGWLFLPRDVDLWEGARELRESFSELAEPRAAR
jgi:hypothetical protein